MNPVFYNVQHSPVGAFASFTLGERGPKGGLGVELGQPACQNVYIGLEDAAAPSAAKAGAKSKAAGKSAPSAPSAAPSAFTCLPFFDVGEDEAKRFDVSKEAGELATQLRYFDAAQITRTLTPGSDTWQAGDLTFRVHSPVCPAPDPRQSTRAAQMLAYAPALAVELTVDNRKGTAPRRAFFGFQGNDPFRRMRRLNDNAKGKFVGVAHGGSVGIASNSPGVRAAIGFSASEILEERHRFNDAFALGGVGLLVGEAPAGKQVTFRFTVLFYRGGIVTTGMKGSYFYSRFFDDMEAVAGFAVANFDALKARSDAFEKRFQKAKLSPERKWMLAHTVHSYYGSTEFLDIAGEPMWVVNEGEYRMMNTFDLTVDQLFFEMDLNPWTVANELDWFVKRYSYRDKVSFPGDNKEHPGGLSFTHDMGVGNHFTPVGLSSYEKTGLHGCFSHMTHEELVNWLVCGLVYARQTGDKAWLKRSRPIFEAGLESLLRRDNPVASRRNGIMALDSSRCSGGSEITTYDSLDVSLGQARNNLYLAVKTWGVYVGLADLFGELGDTKRVAASLRQAALAAKTITESADENGLLPAVLHENVQSRIIPAIEGLIVPYALGLGGDLNPKGPYAELIAALKKHLAAVLQPGVCIFKDGKNDGAWKISSTSENSWLSKIYLCQFVAEKILGFPQDKTADKAHAAWLTDPRNTYWAWSDQIITGEAKASKYYPRGVTTVLWLGL